MLRRTPHALSALVRRTARLCQKKQTSAGYMAQAGKVGGEEKWAQAALEYLHEKNHVNDGSRKRAPDVRRERGLARAFDRLAAAQQSAFDARLSALLRRQSDALGAIAAEVYIGGGGLPQAGEGERGAAGEGGESGGSSSSPPPPPAYTNYLLEEALLLHSAQPPGSLRRPALTPPLAGYESGFGLDVPQLRTQQPEYPRVLRPTDAAQFSEQQTAVAALYEEREKQQAASAGSSGGGNGGGEEEEEALPPLFPFVAPLEVADLAARETQALHSHLDATRAAAPVTGPEGEAHAAYVALQLKALARQQLIIDIASSDVAGGGAPDDDDNNNAAAGGKTIEMADVDYYRRLHEASLKQHVNTNNDNNDVNSTQEGEAGGGPLLTEEDVGAPYAQLYNTREAFRVAEWRRRGILPLEIESPEAELEEEEEGGNGKKHSTGVRERRREDSYHYAQVPAYHPFREM